MDIKLKVKKVNRLSGGFELYMGEVYSVSVEFAALGGRNLFFNAVHAGSRVHRDGRSGLVLSFEASGHGESSHFRRSGGGDFLACALQGNDIVRLDDLGHAGSHHVRHGSLSSERRGFLEFSSLAAFFLFSVLEPTLSIFQSGLDGLLGEDLIDELHWVFISQVIVQLTPGLHDISSTGLGDVGQLVV